MDLNVLRQHCAHCGASVKQGQNVCPVCQQPASDPGAEGLAEKIGKQGAAAIQHALAGKGCANLACATVMLMHLESHDAEVVKAAAQALETTHDRVVLRELLALLGTGRWLGHPVQGNFTVAEHGATSISAVICGAFKKHDDLRHALLLEETRHPDCRIREAAVNMFQFCAGEDVRERLLQLLRHDRDAGVRARAAFSLGRQCDHASVDALVHALTDDSSVVQAQAAHALSRLGKSAVHAAASALATGSPELSLHSARLLASHRSPEAIDALVDALRNRQNLVRLYAENALIQIGVDILPALLETLIRESHTVAIRDGIIYVLRNTPMPEHERKIILPVIAAGERLNAAIEASAAAYRALGHLLGRTEESLRGKLDHIAAG